MSQSLAGSEFHSHEAVIPATAGAVVTVGLKAAVKSSERPRDPRDHAVAERMSTLLANGPGRPTSENVVEQENERLTQKHELKPTDMLMCWFSVNEMHYAHVIDAYLMSAKRGDRVNRDIKVEGCCDWRQLLELRQEKGVSELMFEHPRKHNSRIALPRTVDSKLAK